MSENTSGAAANLATREGATSHYQVAVANHRARLLKRYEQGHLETWFFDRRENYRINADRRIAAARTGRLGAWVGFLLGVAVLAFGWSIDHQFVHGENDGGLVALGAIVGIAVWCLCAHLGNRLTAKVVVNETVTTGALMDVIVSARHEIDAAVKRGHADAPAIADAVRGLMPGVEELFDEAHALNQAYERNRYSPVRAEYLEALVEQSDLVVRTLIDITAEIQAVGALLFATREDLLVQLAGGQEPGPLALPVTRLTEEAQRALSQSRKTLANIAEHLA